MHLPHLPWPQGPWQGYHDRTSLGASNRLYHSQTLWVTLFSKLYVHSGTVILHLLRNHKPWQHSTHNERYRLLRMPFGLRMLFRVRLTSMRICWGSVGIADDVEVVGDDSTYDQHLLEIMDRTRKEGIKFNCCKNIINSNSCNVFGHIYTPQEVKPVHDKIQAIKHTLAPLTKQECNLFLGIVNY